MINKNSITRIATLTFGMALSMPASAGLDGWTEMLLFNPPGTQLKAEAGGGIMIYDGVTEGTVDRALSEQFGRIDSMMFTRVRHVLASGEEAVLDDGC